MLDPVGYALLAANAYSATESTSSPNVSVDNEITLPNEWSVIRNRVNPNTGFLARAYKNGGEIVIAYAGTTFEPGMASLDWTNGNLPGATGVSLAKQIIDAAKFYLDVRNDPANAGATISFTGHSLGGGLAALMGVFFNKQASIFDQAPFGRSAESATVVNGLKSWMTANGYAIPAEFADYVPGTSLSARQSLVTETYMKGEALQYLGDPLAGAFVGAALGGPVGAFVGAVGSGVPTRIYGGTPNQYDVGGGIFDAVELHSITLLIAAMQSKPFADMCKANPDFLRQIFQSPLFVKNTPDGTALNLVNLLVQQQAAGNQPLDKLAEDIVKFTGALDPVASNTVGADAKLKSALYQLAIGLYYDEGENRTGVSNTPFDALFKSLSGGIQFAPDPARQGDYLESLTTVLAELGSYSDFGQAKPYLKPIAERYSLPTSGAMEANGGNDNKKDLMLGNTQGDTLSGGGGDDVLIGLGGDDRLDGGVGRDTLFGGKGTDTLIGGEGDDLYVFEDGDGADTIVDEGVNRILVRGKPIAGLFIKDPTSGQYKFVDDKGIDRKLEFHSPGVLTLENGQQITFQNQTSAEALDGSFGIQLYEEKVLPTQFDRTIIGDLVVSSTQDELGNYVPTGGSAPGREDSFMDSAGADLIQGLGGDDHIWSWRGGDDRIDGGDGNDWMRGVMGNDIVSGGAGRDVLIEWDGNDKLYAGNVVTLEAALAAENAAPSGQQGEALSGGEGDDLAVGGIGNDVLFGGTGADILVGGAGDDNIDGDAMGDYIAAAWSVQRSVTTNSYYTSYQQFNMYWPAEGGNDVIYAGAGVDWVRSGYGNDYVDGGNGDDVLFGEGGNDDVFGGSGNDIVVGDDGDDYLDGEDGNDTLWGEGGSNQLFGGAGLDRLYGSNNGSDYLDGEDGDDRLYGGALDDQLFGGSGNDWIQGDSGTGSGDGDDYLDGEAGDDILFGEGGRDELHGGDGADRIAGDNGGSSTSGDADTIYGEAGNDIIDGQGGDDVIDGGADNDLITGNLGNDLLAGGDGDDQLQGGEGNDVLDGGAGSDVLFGEAGNDTLRGDDGTDYLLGGLGDDILDGGAGDDVYYYSTGEGSDRIADSAGTDWLVFTDINWGQIVLGVGSLKLTLPDGSELHLDDFDPDNPYAAGGIEYFQFADGTVLTKTQLINALGIQPTGTPEADVLSGTALSETLRALAGDDVVTARAGNDTVYADDGADTVYGGDGNDILYGGNGDDVLLGENGNDTIYGEAGNDLLAGGAGTDALQGGDGDDIYLFQAGDGQDTATDALGSNVVVLGAGLTLDAIVFTRQGDDLLVGVKNSTDRLTVKDWFAADSHFANITLSDGATLDHAGVEAAMPRNHAPLASPDSATVVEDGTTYVSGNALANDSDPEGRALRIANSGSYAGSVGTLTLNSNGAYSYTLANSSHAVQSLAAGQNLTEIFAYTVTDDDPNGAATATSSIRITVQGANDLPILGADSATTVEDAAPIGGNVLANDHDIDANSVLTVTNPGPRTGSYGSLDLGSDGAWDYSLANTSATVQSLAADQTVTESFAFDVGDGIVAVGGILAISISGQNDAPIIATPLADQSALANSNWSWQMPTGSFTDIDSGDVLGYAATLADGTALPSWLAFDTVTQFFSGRVPKSAMGSIDIRIAATDRQGAAAADIFTLSFAAGSGGGGGGGGGNNGGGSQSNEGVGNGVDGPPPGHDISFNDGAGTGQGNPGAQGGNGYIPPKRADIVMQKVQIAGAQLAEAAAGNEHGNSTNAQAAAPGHNKNLSPGGGSRYQDLPLSRNGNDPLNTGNDESVPFKDWYADVNRQSTLNLQAIAGILAEFDAQGSDSLPGNQSEGFDFKSLGNYFGQMRAAAANRASWNMMDDLLDVHLFGADDAALGNDPAYQYGNYGNLANARLDGGSNVLSGSQSAIGVQAFQSLQGLQEGLARLG